MRYPNTTTSYRNGTALRTLLCGCLLAMSGAATDAAELIYQEGFNTDGEAATPQRYTTEGRDVYEVDRIRNELGIQDQLGPVYWAHNFDVSFVGVPAPTAGRRMLLAWDTNIDGTAVTEDAWELIESTIKWMVNDKAGATIVVSPSAFSLGSLLDRLFALGYHVIDDDTSVTDENLHTLGDLFIHAPGSSNPSRGAQAAMPVLAMVSADHDDMLTSSIGATASFEPGAVTITAPDHPAAGGKTGSFELATTSGTWNLIGDILPSGATTLATFVQEVPPTITSLDDVDAMIAGTKAGTKTSATVQVLDFYDDSFGNWFSDNFIPGDAAGIWGLHASGKLTVPAAGTYSFALGTDDGGRVQIDADKNGFDSGDTILTDAGPHAHQITYGNATFPAAGTYDFQVIAYNSGGGGSVELSVANAAGGDQRDLDVLPENWSNIGDPASISSIQVQGDINVDAYVAAGDPVEVVHPFIVLLNGPNDDPPGSVFGGGPFTGFEGTGFFAMSGGNKWPFPDGRVDRTLTLNPVDVRGEENLKLTVAAAATFLDFETSDYLDIIAYPNGKSGEEVRLARFSAPSGSDKYFADVDHGNINRLGLEFRDVTYDIPEGATDLVIEFRAFSSWWNEIIAFDNVRITAGAEADPIELSIADAGAFFDLSWTGGTGPFLVQGALELGGEWFDIATTSERQHRGIILPGHAFFRIVDQTTKNIQNYHAVLTGAAERPTPVETPATGVANISVDADAKTITYLVAYNDLKQAATMAHIHGPADADGTASPMVTLTAAGPLGTAGIFTGAGVSVTDDQLSAITTGNTYFNVHSGAHGGGEIRGQIIPVPAP